VLVHDAARPLVTAAVVERCVVAAAEGRSAVAAVPVVDTIKEVDDGGRIVATPDRRACGRRRRRRRSRPQSCGRARARGRRTGQRHRRRRPRRPLRRHGHRRGGRTENLKITTPADLAFAEVLLRAVGQPAERAASQAEEDGTACASWQRTATSSGCNAIRTRFHARRAEAAAAAGHDLQPAVRLHGQHLPQPHGRSHRPRRHRGARLDHVAVRSAGIAATGVPASGHAADVAREHGLDLGRAPVAPLTPSSSNGPTSSSPWASPTRPPSSNLGGGEKLAMVTRFLEGDGSRPPVADPFGGDRESYRETFRQLQAAIDALLERLEPILAP
jgi:protein-tyrosine-phosphatase